MLKDLIDSFKENIQTKSTNPFFGTFILVWITKNWNLFYTLFNFDVNTTLVQKRDFIYSHFTTHPFIETLLWCVLETFIILVISYFLINLARLIINFYEKKLTPLVYKWTDENSIVLKSLYDKSEQESRRLEKRLEEEREAKLKLQEDYDKLEKRISDLLMQKNETKTTTTEANEAKVKTDDEKWNSKIELMFNKLKKESSIKGFKTIVESILTRTSLPKDSPLAKEYARLGLIEASESAGPNFRYYILTPLGNGVREMISMQD